MDKRNPGPGADASAMQDLFLEALRASGTKVSVFLVNGIRLIGIIEQIDAYVVGLKAGSNLQMVYKHAISTVLPMEHEAAVTPPAQPGGRVRRPATAED